ncbi:MAG: hypothetical protein AAF745_09500, partial [Planctomycetota bacterium]
EIEIAKVEQSVTAGQINVVSNQQGDIEIDLKGKLGRVSIQQLRNASSQMKQVAEATGQRVCITHDGHPLAELIPGSGSKPRWSVRWLSAVRFLLKRE